MNIPKVIWNQVIIIICAFFNLIGFSLTVDVSNILSTFGDYKPVPYVLLAVIIGIILFPSLGIILATRPENNLLISFLISIILSGLATFYLAINFFVSLLETGIIIFLLTSSETFISTLFFTTFLPNLKNESIIFKILFTDIYTFVFTLVLVIEYILMGQSLLQWLILLVEIIGTIILVLLLVFVRTNYYKNKFPDITTTS